MRTLMKVMLGIGLAVLVIALSAEVVANVGLAAATFGIQQTSSQAPAAGNDQMRTMHQNMMAMRQKMMAEAAASDARLQELVDKMNAAKGEARVDALAAVVTELVQQHKGAPGHMLQMMPNMSGMMEGMTEQMRQMMGRRPSEPSSPKP